MAKRWTEEEEGYILEHYGSMTLEGIVRGMAKLVGHTRTVSALQQHAYFMEITQRDNQGKHSLHQLSNALGIDSKALKSWRTLGLEMVKGYRCFGHRAIMIAVDDLVEFLQSRPELVNPDTCAPKLCREIMLEISALKTTWRWKRVECKNVENHATGKSLLFWAEMYDGSPACPACGRIASAFAIGKTPKSRYSVQKPGELTGIELLSTTKLAFLRSVEARGQATLREVGLDVLGDELRGRGMRGIIRAVLKQGLVQKVARGRIRRHSGPLLLAYEITDAGRSILRDVQPTSILRKEPPRCPGCGKKIVRRPGQKGALPKWCQRDHNSKPTCPGRRQT